MEKWQIKIISGHHEEEEIEVFDYETKEQALTELADEYQRFFDCEETEIQLLCDGVEIEYSIIAVVTESLPSEMR